MSTPNEPSLAGLPTELRIKIFEQLFDRTPMVHVQAIHDLGSLATNRTILAKMSTMHINTLRINHQLRTEALSVMSRRGIVLALTDHDETEFTSNDIGSYIASIPAVWKRRVDMVSHGMQTYSLARYLPLFPNVQHLTIRNQYQVSRINVRYMDMWTGYHLGLTHGPITSLNSDLRTGVRDHLFLSRHWLATTGVMVFPGVQLNFEQVRNARLQEIALNPQANYPFAPVGRQFDISIVFELVDHLRGFELPMSPFYTLCYDYDTCRIIFRRLADAAGVWHALPVFNE